MFLKMPVECHGAAEELVAAMRTLVSRLPFDFHSSIKHEPSEALDLSRCDLQAWWNLNGLG